MLLLFINIKYHDEFSANLNIPALSNCRSYLLMYQYSPREIIDYVMGGKWLTKSISQQYNFRISIFWQLIGTQLCLIGVQTIWYSSLCSIKISAVSQHCLTMNKVGAKEILKAFLLEWWFSTRFILYKFSALRTELATEFNFSRIILILRNTEALLIGSKYPF